METLFDKNYVSTSGELFNIRVIDLNETVIAAVNHNDSNIWNSDFLKKMSLEDIVTTAKIVVNRFKPLPS